MVNIHHWKVHMIYWHFDNRTAGLESLSLVRIRLKMTSCHVVAFGASLPSWKCLFRDLNMNIDCLKLKFWLNTNDLIDGCCWIGCKVTDEGVFPRSLEWLLEWWLRSLLCLEDVDVEVGSYVDGINIDWKIELIYI